jgi:penicillin amidase
VKRIVRYLLAAAGGLLCLLAVAGVAGWLWLRTSLPDAGGSVALDGAHAAVEILRDKDGVPHIFAANAEDAYLALGYVHAQDRLWQMEMMRRLGAGRLSEVVGAATLGLDRYSRTFGLYRLAEAQVERLQPTERVLLDAYARGVNAYLGAHRGALPPEFVLLRHEPEPWRPADSLVWAKIMAMQLSRNWQTELLRWRMSKRLSPEQIRELWPEDDRGAPITLTDRVRAAALPLDGLAAAIPPAFTSADASNAWVVDGAYSATGKPVLANDPHLGLGAPILWYLAHIEAPGVTLTGATVPGVPLLILGHNDRIAWGMTTTGGDIEDLYLEDLDPADPGRYRTPDGPKPFRVRREEIRVKGGEPVVLEVRETRHGPVISDLVRDAGEGADTSQVIALASAALRPEDETARALFEINRAGDWPSFVEATKHFDTPQQNLFYADKVGGIGLISPGRLPVRRSGNGLAPVPGADDVHGWTGFVPFDALPKTHNPPAGRIVNANNRLVGPHYPYDITQDWDTSWRAIRIEEVLAADGRHGVADAAALQMDTLSTAARAVVPLLLAAEPGSPRAAAAMELMRKWDYRMQRDRPEPLIYAAWLRHLMQAIAEDELGPLFDDYGRSRPGFVIAVLTRNRHWCDDVTTPAKEDCAARIALALERALDEIAARQGEDIARWRWGDVHRAALVNRVLAHVPLVGRFANLVVATDGGNDTVNRGLMAESGANPFAHAHGAGFRAVYDLSDLARSRFVIATGQSGNPLSPHYGDMVERWRDGGHVTIATDKEAARRRAVSTLVITPK